MYEPSAFTVTVPTPSIVAVAPAVYSTPPIVNLVTVKVAPASTSVSLINTLPVAGVSSLTVCVSEKAVGASFIGVTVIFKVELTLAVPSLTV